MKKSDGRAAGAVEVYVMWGGSHAIESAVFFLYFHCFEFFGGFFDEENPSIFLTRTPECGHFSIQPFCCLPLR